MLMIIEDNQIRKILVKQNLDYLEKQFFEIQHRSFDRDLVNNQI